MKAMVVKEDIFFSPVPDAGDAGEGKHHGDDDRHHQPDHRIGVMPSRLDSPAPICIRPTPMEQATAPHMVKMLRPWMKVSRPSDFLPMALSRTGPKARGFFMLYAVRAKATAQMVYRQYWGMDHCHMAWEG